jgi:hypothetical protein
MLSGRTCVAVFHPAGNMKAIHVAFAAALLVGGPARHNCWGQASGEKEYLSAVLPQELMRYAGIEVPSRENIQVLSGAGGRYLEFRLVPGQAKKNNGIRAEISVDYPYGVGDIVRYQWEMRLPKDFAADKPRNRWWIMGQWHDQPVCPKMFVELAVRVSGLVQRERECDVDFERTGLD